MTLQIRTVLAPMGPATAIELTDQQVAELGGGKRAAVIVGIGGRTARVRLGVMDGRKLGLLVRWRFLDVPAEQSH